MRTIQVELQGVTPLLMHSAEGMTAEKAKKNPGKVYDNVKNAESVAYRNKDGQLYIPSRCLKSAIINAASWYKFGKKNAKPIIAGCLTIQPYEILLGTKEYTIDLRPVVVQRARIIRARPRLDEWKINFQIIYNEKMIGESTLIQEILEEAGQRVGILDNRPQKYGENGTFKVTKFEDSWHGEAGHG